MTQKIVLELPEPLNKTIQMIASQKKVSVEDVLMNLIEQGTRNVPIELLDDEQILVMCDQSMSENEQEKLSELLAKQREETLGNEDQNQLNQLMQIYREGLVNKAKALKIAVERNLRRHVLKFEQTL